MIQLVDEYKKQVIEILDNIHPKYDKVHASKVIDKVINERFRDTDKVRLFNNYTNKSVNLTLSKLAEYIYTKKPIMTAGATLFNQQEKELSGILKMTKDFLDRRKVLKAEMYKYPKGSEMFNMYNLLQLLAKIDANSLYGAIGQCNSIFYNVFIASSITIQSQFIISTAAATFESFLYNNIKFRNLNEILVFINNVKKDSKESENKKYDGVINRIPTLSDIFTKIISTCGNGYKPTEKEMNIVWDSVQRLDYGTRLRLYYKNNLFEFIENNYIDSLIVKSIGKLNRPFMNPYKPPKEIIDNLDLFSKLCMEYVYYPHPYTDVIDRIKYLPRQAVLVLDTDSNILFLDPWYRTIMDKLSKVDTSSFPVLSNPITPIDIIGRSDEFGDYEPEDVISFMDEYDLDYNFEIDDIIETPHREIPISIGSVNDGLRYSIINMICYVLSNVIENSMRSFTKYNHSMEAEHSKLYLYMKNEYLFKSLMLPPAKRNYAMIEEIQEGKYVGNLLSIKGLAIDKSNTNKKVSKRLKNILHKDILDTNNGEIDQLEVIKKLSIFEKEIINSLKEGKKDYYVPKTSKGISVYSEPMKISTVKSIIAWNEIKEDWQEGFDINEQNGFMTISVDINKKNVENIKDSNPVMYDKLKNLLLMDGFNTVGITSIAVPDNEVLPEWCRDYIDYDKIIQNNLSSFKPILGCIGITDVDSKPTSYTNIIKF